MIYKYCWVFYKIKKSLNPIVSQEDGLMRLCLRYGDVTQDLLKACN